MEEDNKEKNMVESTAEDIGQKAKDSTIKNIKKATKFAAKKVLAAIGHAIVSLIMTLLPYITIILVVVVLIGGFTYLLEMLSGEDTTKSVYSSFGFEDDEDADFAKAVRISADGNGSYYYDLGSDFDEKIEKIVKEINKQNPNIRISDTELIKKFIKTEIRTKLPDLDGDADYNPDSQGTIKIKRYTPNKTIGAIEQASGENIRTLKYVDESSFNSYINNGSEEALNVYTLTGDNKNLVVASWNYSKIEENDETISESFSLEKGSEIDYKSKLTRFTMPFEYPLFFLIDGECQEFSEGLADLANDSSIEIAFIDRVDDTKETTTITEKGTNEIVHYSMAKDESGNYLLDENGNYIKENEGGSDSEKFTNVNKSAITTESSSYEIELKNINSWAFKKNCDIESDFGLVDSQTLRNDVDNTEKSDPPIDEIRSVGAEYEIVETTHILETTTTTVVEDKVVNKFKKVSETNVEENFDGFVNLYKKYQNDLHIEPEWLFELMENNKKTSNMIDLTRLLLYKATGTNYGITDLSQLELFDGLSLNSGTVIKEFSKFGNNLSLEEFIEAITKYSSNTSSSDFAENLANYAEEFYKICNENGINPTYAFVYACIQTRYGSQVTDNNLFAIKDSNDRLKSYSSVSDSIKDFCDLAKDNSEPSISKNEIESRAVSIFGDKIYTVTSGGGNIQLVHDYIAQWENLWMYKYIYTNECDNQYETNQFIYDYVTKDKKYFKCGTDIGANNGTRNFGFGILHYQYGDYNNEGYYSQEGINIRDPKYQVLGTTLPVDLVERVSMKIMEFNRNKVIEHANNVGVTLNDNQINALTYAAHKYGPYDSNGAAKDIPTALRIYKQYGDTEAFRQNCFIFADNRSNWSNALWDVFHNGVYKNDLGETIDTNAYFSNVGSNTQCTFDINLYNSDGSVNLDKIKQLENEESKIINNTRSYKFFSYNGLSYLQCTWWANARASTYLSKFGTKYKEYPTITGNGGDYWQNNINGGWFKYGKEPKANSLLGYKAGSNMGDYGHITYVEAVDPINKKIYISHCSSGERWNGIGYNWGGQHYYALDWDGKLWGELPQGYIYLDEPL